MKIRFSTFDIVCSVTELQKYVKYITIYFPTQ